jgi:hypothetical protein
MYNIVFTYSLDHHLHLRRIIDFSLIKRRKRKTAIGVCMMEVVELSFAYVNNFVN